MSIVALDISGWPWYAQAVALVLAAVVFSGCVIVLLGMLLAVVAFFFPPEGY